MQLFLVVLLSYLLGSVSFGIIVTRIVKGVDIRAYGSGNTGFTNVLRVVGKGPSVLVLLGDALKGSFCVALGYYFGDAYFAVMGGLAAMVGHTYPLYFGFRGGKGVATGLGVMLTLAPDVTIIALIIFILTVLFSRYVSLGSILAALSVLISTIFLAKPFPILLFSILAVSFVIYRHKTNIVRLWQGKENKVGKKCNTRGDC